MRHFVVTDLEGPAGIWRWRQVGEDGPLKAAAMRLLTGEVNAFVDGVLSADPDAEVVVLDGHGSRGLIFEDLHPRALMLPGEVRVLTWLARHGADALHFVGQHSMAGTPEGPLAHTYSHTRVAGYRLNGSPVGEFGCISAVAGELGVPAVFLSGDDKAVAEARAMVPNIVGVAVKEGLGLEAALHLSHQESCRRIRAGAAEVVRRVADIAPVRIPAPYRLRIEMLPSVGVEGLLKEGAAADGDNAVVFNADRVRDLPHI